jgi:hypothetical protein
MILAADGVTPFEVTADIEPATASNPGLRLLGWSVRESASPADLASARWLPASSSATTTTTTGASSWG